MALSLSTFPLAVMVDIIENYLETFSLFLRNKKFINRKLYIKYMKILGSGIQYKIIEYLLSDTSRNLKVVEIAKAANTGKGYVSKTLKSLENDGLIEKGRIDVSNPRITAMKILINMNKIVDAGVIKKIGKLDVIGAGIYGSWASGKNNQESDIDIWIKPREKIKEADIATVSRQIRESLNANPQILVLDSDRIKQLKMNNMVFYHSLIFGSIQIFGEPLE